MKPIPAAVLLAGLLLLAGCGEPEPVVDAPPDPRLADAKRTVGQMGIPQEPHNIGTMSPLELLAAQNR